MINFLQLTIISLIPGGGGVNKLIFCGDRSEIIFLQYINKMYSETFVTIDFSFFSPLVRVRFVPASTKQFVLNWLLLRFYKSLDLLTIQYESQHAKFTEINPFGIHGYTNSISGCSKNWKYWNNHILLFGFLSNVFFWRGVFWVIL